MSRFDWATVTAVAPLRIRLDGDQSALPFTPESLIDPTLLAVSERVRIEIARGRVLIHGRSGGDGDSAARAALVPAGVVLYTVARTAPSGWLIPNGGTASRSSNPNLFAACNPVVGTPTVTIASPGVFTLTGHGLYTGQNVYLTTTGALPTGLTTNTSYWVIRVDANTFRLATSFANAVAGTAINTSGTQSGTHTIRSTFGVGDGSTTFTLPLLLGKVVVGVDTGQSEFAALGYAGGAKTHTLTNPELPNIPINIRRFDGDANDYLAGSNNAYGIATPYTAGGTEYNIAYTGGGGGAHNNLQPYVTLTPIIKAG